MGRRTVSKEDIEKMRELTLKHGLSVKVIAERMNLASNTVRDYTRDLRNYREKKGDYIYYLESPTGERFVIEKDLVKWSIEHGLVYTNFARICSYEGVKKGWTHRGWKAYKPAERGEYRDRSAGSRLSLDTMLELELLIGQGYTAKEIANQLGINERTAQKYIQLFEEDKDDYLS